MNAPMFQRGADASRLHEELTLTPVGKVVTYERLTDALGKPVTGASGALTSARRIAQREDGMVFACIRGAGLKRLDSEAIVDMSGMRVQGVRRHARRVVKTLTLAIYEELRDASKQKAIAIASVLSVVADLAREKSIHTVEIAASGRAARLPIAETLRALGLSARSKEERAE